MTKIKGTYFGGMLILLSAALLLNEAGCSSLRRAERESDSDFYRSYSKKMGVSFSGTEEKSLIRASAGWLGVPYRYGGQNRSGVDCSALVRNLYKEAYGITLPRSSSMIAKQAKHVKKRNLACGDLLFFTIKEKKVSHMGMYLANNKFLHASTSKGVSVADLSDKYWSKYFSGAGRVHTPATGARAQAKQPPAAATGKKKSAAAEAVQPNPPKENTKAKSKSSSSDSSNDVIIVFDEEF
ncbi:MAG: C40 family peptidase [Prevotellaceae bacterium]|jgi:topoisomerase IA-like protein|nr:C40 family peptidase [Prevotellaceae bacterium]